MAAPRPTDGRNTSVSTASSQPTSSRRELKLGNGRFMLRAKLGSGSFGDIFRGLDTWQNKEVAIKLENSKTRHPQLCYESKVYRLLHQGDYEVVGIPVLYWYGNEGEHNGMAMELCGPCLEDVFNYCLRKFSVKTVFMIADQMLHRIEFIHLKGLVHRDIKPENYVFGMHEKAHHLMMIDFGLSKRYWDNRTRTHIPFREGKPLTGTARYCSSNTHRGFEQSRRDDLESIGYLLIYFLAGQLPWQGIASPDAQSKTLKIGDKKINTSMEDLCQQCPPEILTFMKYCRALKFTDAPDYAYLRQLLRGRATKDGFAYDWVFDWNVKRDAERAAGTDEEFASAEHSLPMGSENPAMSRSAASSGAA